MIRNAKTEYILEAELRGRSVSPIISCNVYNDTYYSIALIDETETFILWYVNDIHGYDLLQGYDSYICKSGKTLFEYQVPSYNSKGKLLLMQSDENSAPDLRRYDCINKNLILDTCDLIYDKKNESEKSCPLWYAHFCSLSRSSNF